MIALHSKDITQAFHRDYTSWLKGLIYAVAMFAILFFCQQVFAADGNEFANATAKVEGWVKGNLGKLAALLCVAIGAIVAAVKKDWTWLGGAIVLAMFVGIILGIINASFTATI
jgi:conjugal transfer pilus assembly protein TraA